jgi:hypothetical protein
LQNEPEAEDRTEDQGFSITDNAILEAFKMIPFASIRQIAKMTFLPLTSVFRCLTKYRCSPEAIVLDSSQTLGSWKTDSSHHVKGVAEVARVHETSFVQMQSDAQRGLVLSFIFLLITNQESISLSPENEAPPRERKIVSSPKIMLTVA